MDSVNLIVRHAATSLGASMLLASADLSSAASLTWGPAGTGDSGTWIANSTANWFNGNNAVNWPAPGGTDNDAVFAGTAGTVSLATGGITVGNPLTASDTWRQTYFGTTANTGNTADNFESDTYSKPNLIEFATAQSPHAATRALTNAAKYPAVSVSPTPGARMPSTAASVSRCSMANHPARPHGQPSAQAR